MFERLLPAYRHEEGRDQEQELAKLKQRNRELENDLSELQKRNAELESRLAKVESVCSEYCDENTRLHIENDEMSGRFKELEAMLLNQKKCPSSEIQQSLVGEEAESVSMIGINSASEEKQVDLLQNRVKFLKLSKNKLKKKTKELLRHYRIKRTQLEKRERQLLSQKNGLQKLQDLHSNLQTSFSVVLEHLAEELSSVSRLVGLLGENEMTPPTLVSSTDLHYSFSQLEHVIHWTRQSLIQGFIREIEADGTQQSDSLIKRLEHKILAQRKAGRAGTEEGPLRSISESLTSCTDTQHSTLKDLLKELDL